MYTLATNQWQHLSNQLATRPLYCKQRVYLVIVFRCDWHGSSCEDSGATFMQKITDYGVCYTFNYDGRIESANTGRALFKSLYCMAYRSSSVLNSEQENTHAKYTSNWV